MARVYYEETVTVYKPNEPEKKEESGGCAIAGAIIGGLIGACVGDVFGLCAGALAGACAGSAADKSESEKKG